MTNAAYNALEVTLQHKMTHGVQFDYNYTYGKSIDIASDAERVGTWGGLGGQIINAWNPSSNRAPSDFDLRHQMNANFIWELPFGQGQAIAHDANKFVEAIIGGWQLSGLIRWTSGFPVNVDNGGQYPTNYQLEGNAVKMQSVTTGTNYTGAGGLNGGQSLSQPVRNRQQCLGGFWVCIPWGHGSAQPAPRSGLFRNRHGAHQALADAVERQAELAVPLGSFQRHKLRSL